MMNAIPSAVLSEHFQEHLKGRRLVSALFTTFRLEPSFFETEVLPIFFDIPLSHAPAIKLVQLEDAIRSLPGTLAVYYDQNGLVADGGAAKLDVRRYSIRHPTGIFHPKNVLALVEDAKPDENGKHARALLCASASANLTRAGWWENVEAAHIETIAEGELTNLRDPLIAYVDDLVRAVEGRHANDDLRAAHGAAKDIRAFLLGTAQREHRSQGGRIHPHFHSGDASLPDFIERVARGSLFGLCLEVISPYFDGGDTSAPLQSLLERFQPKETRLFLPRNDRGEALCTEGLYSWVKENPATTWGSLPGDLLKNGNTKDAKPRAVHAKVYRFFEPKRGGREVLFVGSANLTIPGCRVAGRGGNWETGFLVEATSKARPDWWLISDVKRPSKFAPRVEDEGTASSEGTRLVLRFHWDTHEGTAFWNDATSSPRLAVRHGGVDVLKLAPIPPRVCSALDGEQCKQLERTLASTSLLEVVGESPEPGLLLVQEEGMSHRPSLLLDLTAADILRYWALLTVEQRAAFLEASIRITGDEDPLMARLAPLAAETTLFDRFAGIFQAFACLEERARAALAAGSPREADYRLFGRKYDSLGNLLQRVLRDVVAGSGDRIDQYVMTLCAKQTLREIGRDFPEYWAAHRDDVNELETLLTDAATIRAGLAGASADMPEFLDWFESWFLKRARALPDEAAT